MKLTRETIQPHWIEIDELKFFITQPTEEQEIELQEILLSNVGEQIKQARYARLYLRCVIKDWEGIDEPCQIVNNKLEYNLSVLLTVDLNKAITLWSKFVEDLKFTETDKKKS